MKTLITALLILSASAFANNRDLDATEALTSFLPIQVYYGNTPNNQFCRVSIRPNAQGILITAQDANNEASRIVPFGSTYRWNPGNRSFLSSSFVNVREGRIENVFRTIAVENNTQYIVVSTRLESSNRENREDKVECIVNL